MTEQEFDIIDELYFPLGYSGLLEELEMSREELSGNLCELIRKGWIKPLKTPDQEWEDESWLESLEACFFLATKEGLMVHNMR